MERTGSGSVEIRLASGERFKVDGTFEEVEKRLSDASRSAASRLAWFSQSEGGASVAINPAQVESLVDG